MILDVVRTFADGSLLGGSGIEPRSLGRPGSIVATVPTEPSLLPYREGGEGEGK